MRRLALKGVRKALACSYGIRRAALHVVPALFQHLGLRIVAGGQPDLRAMREVERVGSRAPARPPAMVYLNQIETDQQGHRVCLIPPETVPETGSRSAEGQQVWS